MTSASPTAATADFARLPLSPAMLANLQQLGYLTMTPIQAASLPAALLGKDLIAQAKTGSGKTAAFALTLLASLNPRRFAVQALVLCPTRELADQVTTEIRRLARADDNIKVVTLCGGVPLRGQLATLEHGAHIVVGTPGRVMDHLAREQPEARCAGHPGARRGRPHARHGLLRRHRHRGAPMPERAPDAAVLGHLPGGHCQAGQPVHARADHRQGGRQHAGGQIEQRWYEVKDSERLHTVSLLLNHFRPASTLAFCNTKAQCRDLAEVLQGPGFQRAGAVWRAGAARARPGAGAVCQPQLLGAGGHRRGRTRAWTSPAWPPSSTWT
jgi:ATP-independent RNA helicase DbpA